MEAAKKIIMLCACLALPGCGDWDDDSSAGRAACSFGDWLPAGGKPLRMAMGNGGSELCILDNFSKAYYYKRDNIYDCSFDFEDYYSFSGFPGDILFSGGSFYAQDRALLKSLDDKELCNAKDGFFALSGQELAVGSNAGIDVWDIKSGCSKKGNISSQSVLALGGAGGELYAAEGGGAASEPLNLAVYRNGALVRREPLSITAGNEKNFCAADRIAASDYGIYLLDKKCRKIGVFNNQAYWRKTISLDSLGIKDPVDISAGEYSYIFILRESGVEKVNAF